MKDRFMPRGLIKNLAVFSGMGVNFVRFQNLTDSTMTEIEIEEIISKNSAENEFEDMSLTAKILHDPENVERKNNRHCVVVGDKGIVIEVTG